VKTFLGSLVAILLILSASVQVSARTEASSQELATGIAFVQTAKQSLGGYSFSIPGQIAQPPRMALDGDILAIGFPGQAGAGGVYSSGVVIIFERNQGSPGNWGLSKVIPNPNNVASDEFGDAVALQGTTLVVGMPGYDLDDTDVGAVYIYERNQGGDGNWGLAQMIEEDGSGYDWALKLGYSLSLDGDRLAVSAPYRPLHACPGRVYLYERDPGGDGTWEFAEMIADESGSTDFGFGINIALDDDILAVGAPRVTSSRGAVRIFQRGLVTAESWDYLTTVSGDDDWSGYFGTQLALDGDILSVGAPGFHQRLGDGSLYHGGSAFVFERDQGGADQWGLVSRFTDEAREYNDVFFGYALGVQGDVLLVGEPLKDITTNEVEQENQGAVFLYERATGGANQWGQGAMLLNGDGDAADYFGVALAYDEDTLAVIGQQSVYMYEKRVVYRIYVPIVKR